MGWFAPNAAGAVCIKTVLNLLMPTKPGRRQPGPSPPAQPDLAAAGTRVTRPEIAAQRPLEGCVLLKHTSFIDTQEWKVKADSGTIATQLIRHNDASRDERQ
jgi:hypothetical protein